MGTTGEVGGGWATVGDAPSGYGRGDGSPHPRGQRGEGRLIFHVFTGAGSAREKRMLVCGGWATARVAPAGYGRGDGSPHPRGQRGGRRGIRPYGERGEGWGPATRFLAEPRNAMFYEGGWVSACAGKTGGGRGDREGRSFEVRKRGWVPACARTTGG